VFACADAVFGEKVSTPGYSQSLVEIGAANVFLQPTLANSLSDQLHRSALTSHGTSPALFLSGYVAYRRKI
jgi:hypothetical protein